MIFSVFDLLHPYTGLLPDSTLLIVVGLVIGAFLKEIHLDSSIYSFNSDVFFLYLLPPIIFDAGSS